MYNTQLLHKNVDYKLFSINLIYFKSFQTAEKDEFEDKQKEVEKVCMPIISKLYQAAGGAPSGMPGSMPGSMPGAQGPDTEAAAAGGSGPTIEEVD